MSNAVNIEFDDRAMLLAIARALQTLAHPRAMLAQIGAKMEANAQQRFASRTDPSGAAWPALAPATVAIYSSAWFIKHNPAFKGGLPGSLLTRTNQLRQSLAFNASDDALEIGTSRATKGGKWQVGFLHEFGTAKMPRRALLTANAKTGELGAQDRADMLAIVAQTLGRAFA